jgi:hypothetical protein
MSLTRAWQESYPTDENYGYELDDYQRQIRQDVRERLAVQHKAYSDETGHSDVGEHTPGECTIAFIGDKADFPTPATSNSGCLAVATDESNQIYYWTGSAWAKVQEVVLTSGDQTIGGAKTFSGIATLANGSKLATSAAPTTDPMIANKKYVDDSIPGAFSPASYSGEESCTLPNGWIMKIGSANSTQDAAETFTFDEAFPHACIAAFTNRKDAGGQDILPISTVNAAYFKIDRHSDIAGTVPFFWIAIGY